MKPSTFLVTDFQWIIYGDFITTAWMLLSDNVELEIFEKIRHNMTEGE